MCTLLMEDLRMLMTYLVNTYSAASYDDLYYPNGDDDIQAATKIITSSPWFGEMSQSFAPLQGFISHPSTPLRIEQLKPAVKLSAVIKKIFEIAETNNTTSTPITYDASFLSTQDDVFVLPNLLGAEGVVGAVGNTQDNFVLDMATQAGVNIDKGSTFATNTIEEDQFRFGDGTVTQPSGSSSNVDNGTYIVPNPGTYELQFTGEFTVTGEDLNGSQFATHQAVLYVNDQIVERVQLDTIHRTNRVTREWTLTYKGNLKVGSRVTVGLITNKHKGGNRTITATLRNWQFASVSVAKNWTSTIVNIGDQFIDTKALDFLRGIVQKQNLVIYKDKNRRNHYIIRQYNDWILGGNLIDWSDRVGDLVQSNLLLEQERELIFQDAESDDRFNAEFIQEYDLPRGTEEKVSEDIGISTGDKTIGDFFVPTIPATLTRDSDKTRASTAQVSGVPQLYELEDNVKTIIETGIHLGYSRCTNSGGRFFYEEGAYSVAYNGMVRTLGNVSEDFKRNLNYKSYASDLTAVSAYDLFWSQYYNHLYINNNVKVTTSVLLNPSEYQTLDIQDTVHINGNDYLINKINGFNLSRPDEVEVELISYKNNFTNVYEEPTIRYVEPVDLDLRTHVLGINVVALDDGGIPWTIPVIQQDTDQIILEGEAGATVTETLIIRHIEGLRFDLSGSNFTPVLPLPAGVTVGVGVDVGGDVHIPITATIQPEHTFEYLEIRGEVDPVS